VEASWPLSDAERLDLVARKVAKAAKPPNIGRKERRALTADKRVGCWTR
jgi:hypothetical protein